jgi:hypothetical protein
MKANATVAEWYRTKGRHAVYAKNQELPLPEATGSIVMPESARRMQDKDDKKTEGRSPDKRRLPLVPAA